MVEGVETFFFILQTEEGTGVTLGQVMFCEQAAAVRGEPQQAAFLLGEKPEFEESKRVDRKHPGQPVTRISPAAAY